MARGVPHLRMLSVNVNGLCGQDKRRALFHTLQASPWDVVGLQETHHGDADEADRWAKEGAGPTMPWLGPTFWAQGSRGQRGVALLFKESLALELQPELVHCDPEGRFITVQIAFHARPMLVTSVYAPCVARERAPFFLGMLQHLDPGHLHLLGGDFNCIGDLIDQSVATAPHGHASQTRLQGYAGGLQLVEDRLSLVDSWRALHPDAISFTHTGTARRSHARLDRWLASNTLQASVTTASMVHDLPGDHLGVSITLVAHSGPHIGPGMWRLPTWVVSDPAFLALGETRIPLFWAEHPHSPTLSHGQRWEDFKTWLRDLAQGFILGRKQRDRMATSVLTSAAKLAHERFCANPHNQAACEDWLAARCALVAFMGDQANTAAIRAGLLYERTWEKNQPVDFTPTTVSSKPQTLITSLVPPG